MLERAAVAGGNSTSFLIDGIWCDYGSHRFHPVADPQVLADVKALVGSEKVPLDASLESKMLVL